MTLDHCIVGPIVAVEGTEVTANDSVIDAWARGRGRVLRRAPAGGGGLLTVSNAADRETGDGLTTGGRLTLEACRVLGRVHAEQLDVSDSLLLAELAGGGRPWPAPVWAERRQVGCVRFSFVPPGLAHAAALPVRRRRPGAPAVPHLAPLRRPGLRAAAPLDAPTRSARADDESEMGVTHVLFAPQREAICCCASTSTCASASSGLFYAT